LKKTKKPFKKAVSLANIKLGKKYVVLHLEEGVVTFNNDSSVIMDAMLVLGTDFEGRTLTFSGFDLHPKTVQLAELGIPVLEAGGIWGDSVCTVKLKHAIKAYRGYNKSRKATLATPRHEITIGDAQRISAAEVITPS
jgi:hypothetical protein